MAVIVFDADNTLWNGVLVEGPVEIKLGAVDALKELKKRGHQVIICSKNNPGDLTKKLEEFGFLAWVDAVYASWEPKSTHFKKFMTDEPTLFVDDEPFEHAEVQRIFPDIEAVSADPLDILTHDLVLKEATDEDRKRIRLLREKAMRRQAEEGYSGGYMEFLRDCNLHFEIGAYQHPQEEQRSLDLLNRTNELKATRARYPELPSSSRLITGRLVDKFGDYGQVLVMLVRDLGDSIYIEDIAVSCRTIGRGIGTAAVIYLMRYAARSNLDVLGFVEPTEKNWRMQSLFEFLDFQDEGGGYWRKPPTGREEYPEWLEVHER